MFACNAYMPQASSKEPCDAAYAKLEENVIFFRQQGCVIVLGDLNARVGPGSGLPRVRTPTPLPTAVLTGCRWAGYQPWWLVEATRRRVWHTCVGSNGTNDRLRTG